VSTYPDAKSVVNAALEEVAAQTQITALTDGSTAAKAALVVYQPTVQLLLRAMDPDFARFTDALGVATGTPPPPWTYQYTYPTNCLRLRQVRPLAGSYDVNDPQPIRSNIAVATVSTVLTRIILTNQANALAVYTTSDVTEPQWDSVFSDAVVRRLANPLAMALSGRPDFARELLEEASRIAELSDSVDESMVRP
jgi:hypothetical protein